MELALSFLIFGLLALVMLFMNSLLGPRKPNPAREKPFECGSPYLQTGIRPVRVPFFMIALLFLLPFLDRVPKRPARQRPVMLALVVIILLIVIGLTVWGQFS